MSTPAVLIATAKVSSQDQDAFTAWQARHDAAVAKFPGFISSDLIPPGSAGEDAWTFILNFATHDELANWQKSPERAAILTKALPFFKGGNLGEIMKQGETTLAPTAVVTQVIVSKVKPGMEEKYRAWTTRMQSAQSRYPGYRGMYLQPPAPGQGNHWTTLLRYDTAAHMDAWMAAPERAALLAESGELIESEELMRLATNFPGWAPIPPEAGKAPPDWKPALLVLLGLFPIVMLEMKYLKLGTWFGFDNSLSTFIGNAISVALTSFGTIPLFIKWFSWWLFPKEDNTATLLKGLGILAVLFIIEVIAFRYM
ncbi:MAG: antibiotic biosynthesis monooxygenase [Candidatus Methylacidiphilales bacterium]